MRRDYKERNVDAGIDPVGLADIMGMNLLFRPMTVKRLAVRMMTLKKQFFDSIKLSKEAFEDKAELVGMKGE